MAETKDKLATLEDLEIVYKAAGKVSTVNSVAPDENKNITLTATDIKTSDGTTVEAAIAASGKVDTVNNIAPDKDKNISLAAGDIPYGESNVGEALNQSSEAITAQASIDDTGLITYSNTNGTALYTLQLPLYDGGVG